MVSWLGPRARISHKSNAIAKLVRGATDLGPYNHRSSPRAATTQAPVLSAVSCGYGLGVTGEQRDGSGERAVGQRPLVHDTPADSEPHDSNETADDAVEIQEPDGTPIERDDG